MASSTSQKPGKFDSDLPISPSDNKDRLGFQRIAQNLAASLISRVSKEPLVLSIEGAWGTGKSSLVNFLTEELNKETGNNTIAIRFEPWLVGDRDTLLEKFMAELAGAVETLGTSNKAKNKPKNLAKKLRGYGASLSKSTAPLVGLAGVMGMPGGKAGEKFLEIVAQGMEPKEIRKPLQERKKDLTDGLKKLKTRIVIIIDDLDRLEPDEATEIIRLIKAVADFPNLIYVLCYDPRVLSESLQTSLSLENGKDFLEKIVQVRFSVPDPEPFDLRKWLLEEASSLYETVCKSQLPRHLRVRLGSVCDIEGQLLKTPRSVVRALNAIKLHWIPVYDKVDFPDLVWLQMVRINSEELYDWIEGYLNEYISLAQGGTKISNPRIKEREKELEKCIQYFGDKYTAAGDPRSIFTVADYIPGIKPSEKINSGKVLYDVNQSSLQKLSDARRLGSPDHSRYYFAFAKPAGALSEDVELFISSARNYENLLKFCNSLIEKKRPQGGNMFEALIDRLKFIEPTKFNKKQAKNIILTLSNVMDHASESPEPWGAKWTRRHGVLLTKNLLSSLPSNDRQKTIKKVFGSGDAIGWLMADLIRGELFAHGKVGDEAKPKSDWLFSEEELKISIQLMLKRFKGKDRNHLIEAPELLLVLYGWQQSGDKKGVKEWVDEQLKNDQTFLKMLSGCRGWMVSDRVYYPLNRRDLDHFLDFDDAVLRLEKIKENNKKSEKHRKLADELLEAAKIGKDH